MAGERLKERMARLETLLGDWPEDEDTVTAFADSMKNEFEVQRNLMEASDKYAGERIDALKSDLHALMAEYQDAVQSMGAEISILKKAVAQSPSTMSGPPQKVRVPESKGFGGARNAKELEYFLWNMEQFFKAAHVPDSEMVSITSMYLFGDAKLWWRTWMGDDAESGSPQNDTWETLKRELKEQFLPTNSTWLARESLKRLKHTCSVREYVKEFSSIMLDIKNMSDEDKLFNFISGLQGWAQTELRRQGVCDLPTAMAAADCLVDYKMGSTINTTGKSKTEAGKKGKAEGKPSFNKKAGWKGTKKGAAETKPVETTTNFVQQTTRLVGCFIYNGPHRAKDCPKREKLSALVTADDKASTDSDSPSRVNPLQLLNAISGENQPQKTLMHVQVLLNGIRVNAMVDSGATHNFVATSEASRLDLKLVDDDSRIKAVNSKAQKIQGIAKDVLLQVGEWKGKINLLCVPLDDFNLILGIDFFLKSKAALIPHLGGLMILEEKQPYFVPAVKGKAEKHGKAEMVSALQLKKGLKRGQETYLAALVEINEGHDAEVPDFVAGILKEFRDIMPFELPKELPPRRPIDHKIELLPGAKPPAQVPYRMAPAELLELRKQLKELLDSGMIQPSRAPFGAPVLF